MFYSSYGAEILAYTKDDGKGLYLKQAYKPIAPHDDLRYTFTVDSKGIYDTIKRLHEGKDYILKQTAQMVRDSFESGDIDMLRWVQETSNLADALTKRNAEMNRILMILRTEKMNLPKHRSFHLNSRTWT